WSARCSCSRACTGRCRSRPCTRASTGSPPHLGAGSSFPSNRAPPHAAAADVSERTFFRYFSTNEDVVQFDRFDVSMVEAFREQPPHLGVMDAARTAIEETLAAAPPGELRAELLRLRLLREEPELRATLVTTISSGEMPELFTQTLTERLGERADATTSRK